MTTQLKFLSFASVLGRTLIGNNFRYTFPALQQIACLKKSLEEQLNIPPKPKRPLTPYFKFLSEVRPKIQKELPHAKVTDVVREGAVRWEKVEPEVRQKLEAEYKKELEVFSKEKLKYDSNLTEDQKEALKQARIERLERKEKLKRRQKVREHNKPKRPCSAFVLYMNSQLPKRDSRTVEWRKEVAAKWHLLSNEEKQPFYIQTNEAMREYQKQMVEWERQMIKMGNTDIVRQNALLEPKPKIGSKPKVKKSE